MKYFLGIAAMAIFAGLAFLAIKACKPDFPISEPELLNKTKAQIVNIVFEKSEKNSFGKYQIAAISESGSHQMLFFDSEEEALKSQKLMSSNIWGCFFAEVPFKIDGETLYYKITFENDESAKIQACKYSEF